MIYTLNDGVDDKRDRLETYILRGLPIVVAGLVAIAGAFGYAGRQQTNSLNQEPLAIYTAPPTDLGDSSNPQGNSGDPQSNSVNDGSGAAAAVPKPESRAEPAPASGNTASVSASPTPSATVTTQPFPVGGSGGGGSCPCQTVQGTVTNLQTTVASTTNPVPVPVLP